MIGPKLVQALQERFADRSVTYGDEGGLIATFAAAHPEVGDLQIWDDGGEATIAIGDLTHHHINPYDPALAPAEVASHVTEEVVQFLEKLFADQMLLSVSITGGGAMLVELDGSPDTTLLNEDDRHYVWSGPVGERP